MYVTILTGRVAPVNWIPLKNLFERIVTKNPPAGLLKSCLVQSEDEPNRWRIVSLWLDKAAFEGFESTGPTDEYAELMCDSGTAPYRHGYLTQGWYERV